MQNHFLTFQIFELKNIFSFTKFLIFSENRANLSKFRKILEKIQIVVLPKIIQPHSLRVF